MSQHEGPGSFSVKNLEKAACPAGQRQVYIADQKSRGLYLQIAAGGRKTFVYRRKMDGTWRQQILGPFPETKIEQARKMAAEMTARITDFLNERKTEPATALNPFDEMKGMQRESTLQELFEGYCNEHLRKSRKTADTAEKDFARWFGSLSKKKAVLITHKDAEKLHGQLAKDRGEYAANRAIQLGRAVFNWGKRKKLFFDDNPFAGVSLFKEKSRDRFLSLEEYSRVIKALDTETNDRLRDILWIALLSAARKQNVLSMRWADINFDQKTWTIPETKNGTSQIIPLTEKELEILRGRRKRLKGEFVFPGDKPGTHVKDLKRSWTTFRKKHGIDDVTFHDLRRSFAAAMAGHNENLALIKSTLNHKDLKTTANVYARVNKAAELAAKQRTQEKIMAAKPEEPTDNVVELKKANQ